jgi:hypothetical protein
LLVPRWDGLAAAGVIAIGTVAPLAAVIVVAWAAIGQRLAGHHATGAMVWQAGLGAQLLG